MQNASTARNSSSPAPHGSASGRRSDALALATPAFSALGAAAGLVVLAVFGG
jgi:hypothetical protein